MLWQQIDINIINIFIHFSVQETYSWTLFCYVTCKQKKRKKKKRSDVVFMIIIITFVIYLVSEVLIDRLSSDQIWR